MTDDRVRSLVIRARAVTGFEELVTKLGGNPARLLRKAGFTTDALRDLETPLPLARMAVLLDQVARDLDAPDFGLQLAKFQDISVLGPIAMIVRFSPTLGEALQAIARSMPYHSSGASLLMTEDIDPAYVCLRYELMLDADVPRRQAVELSYATSYQFLRMSSGSSGKDWRLLFRHASGLSRARYRKHFDAEVHLGQPIDAICFPKTLLAVPIDQENRALRQLAERFVNNVVRRHSLDISQQVLALAGKQLAAGGATIKRIAQQLGMHPRTLQRRLQEQNLYFDTLIDQLKKARAEEYLGYGAVPIPEVALLVGYSEPSPFFRACKRWFGMTPLAYRECLANRSAEGGASVV